MEEITVLKSEIERLNRIITVLVEEISIIRSENTVLRKSVAAKDSVYTIVENDKGIKESRNTIVKNDNGTKESSSTIIGNDNGITELLNTNIKNDNGTNESGSTIVKSDNGTNEVGRSIAENDNGIKSNLSPVAKNAPAIIEINDFNAVKLTREFHKIFHIRTKYRKLKSVAKELLLLHNQGSASSDELCKISGLSKPGYAKHAPTLRRAGLIYRHSYQKYMLTEMSKGMINRVFGSV